jgi:hypothetical protein
MQRCGNRNKINEYRNRGRSGWRSRATPGAAARTAVAGGANRADVVVTG